VQTILFKIHRWTVLIATQGQSVEHTISDKGIATPVRREMDGSERLKRPG